jgi:hypothetical protein
MARNTSHLAPSKRLKTYSGRSGSTGQSWTNPSSVKVRSGKSSQKEYIGLRSFQMKSDNNIYGTSQSFRDKNK